MFRLLQKLPKKFVEIMVTIKIYSHDLSTIIVGISGHFLAQRGPIQNSEYLWVDLQSGNSGPLVAKSLEKRETHGVNVLPAQLACSAPRVVG